MKPVPVQTEGSGGPVMVAYLVCYHTPFGLPSSLGTMESDHSIVWTAYSRLDSDGQTALPCGMISVRYIHCGFTYTGNKVTLANRIPQTLPASNTTYGVLKHSRHST